MSGRGVSVVQSIGLDLLMYVDGLIDSQNKEDQMKAALVASGQYSLASLFPQVEAKAVTASEPATDSTGSFDDDAEFDYSGVEWTTPSVADIEEMALLAQTLGQNGVSVNEDDFSTEDSEAGAPELPDSVASALEWQ